MSDLKAQSTISDRPLEVSTGQGLWGAWLPKYSWGETPSGNAVISDGMDLFGYHGDLKIVRRFWAREPVLKAEPSTQRQNQLRTGLSQGKSTPSGWRSA